MCFLYVWRRDVNRSNVKRNDVKQSKFKKSEKDYNEQKGRKEHEVYEQSLWTEQDF